MTTWVTSDLHFNHTNIREYTERHTVWDSLDAMNEGLITNINADVAEDDTLIIVGDVCMGKILETLPEFLPRINCKHLKLVLGNHDRPHPCNKKKLDYWMDEYNKYFEWIGIHLLTEIAGEKVEFNHFPFHNPADDGDYQGRNFSAFEPVDEGQWLIHGHVHSSFVVSGKHQIHVGIDADYRHWGVERYHPIPLDVIGDIITLTHEVEATKEKA